MKTRKNMRTKYDAGKYLAMTANFRNKTIIHDTSRGSRSHLWQSICHLSYIALLGFHIGNYGSFFFFILKNAFFSRNSNTFIIKVFRLTLAEAFEVLTTMFFQTWSRILGLFLIIILSYLLLGYPWPSLATPPYRSSLLAGLQGYTPYPHRAAVCRFELVTLLLLGHVKGSIGVHHLWDRPYLSSSVLHVWFV